MDRIAFALRFLPEDALSAYFVRLQKVWQGGGVFFNPSQQKFLLQTKHQPNSKYKTAANLKA
jgi:hypothetical protein